MRLAEKNKIQNADKIGDDLNHFIKYMRLFDCYIVKNKK